MPLARHLPNAPIQEALIDIFVKLAKDVNLTLLRKLCETASGDYPIVQEIREAELEVDIVRDKLSHTRTATGFRCLNREGNRVVQFRLNGFTYNWLKPYERWETFRDVAKEFWGIYSNATKPTSVLRVGLRYINNLEFPATFEDFKQLFSGSPEIPETLPQTVTRFITRVSITKETTDCSATITQAFEGIVDPKTVPIILDIETLRRSEFATINDDEIWKTLEDLHTFKNEIFFSSLTEEAVRLFE